MPASGGPAQPRQKPHITIVGAGIAGLSAALRLLERGIDVTLFEQDDFIGGKLGAHRHGPGDHDYHEHSYHMYLNWYNNFWRIVNEAGVGGSFAAQHSLTYVERGPDGPPGRSITTVDVGATDTALTNLFSGLRSPADMMVFGYSLIDLLATPAWRHSRLEQTSVLGFMNSRPYHTGAAMSIQQDMLSKAFACPSFLTSARSYRRFIGYGYACPSPMMYLMRGNTQQFLFEPIERHLGEVAARSGATFDIRRLHQVTKLEIGPSGAADAIRGVRLRKSPSIDQSWRSPRGAPFRHEIDGDLILAIPAVPLGELVDRHVFAHAPELAAVRRLMSQPMMSLDLYFNRKLPDIASGITNLPGSAYGLSFIDLSQTWTLETHSGNTFINLVASDCVPIAGYGIAMTTDLLIEDLARFIAFDRDRDIDSRRTHLNSNLNEPLFTNQVGSWPLRPTTTCGIPNMFIAGDFCRTPIDVVTIEGAVVSGLQAAEAVRARAAAGKPIEIVLPRTVPDTALAALKLLGGPVAYAAKAMSVSDHWLRHSWRDMFPRR